MITETQAAKTAVKESPLSKAKSKIKLETILIFSSPVLKRPIEFDPFTQQVVGIDDNWVYTKIKGETHKIWRKDWLQHFNTWLNVNREEINCLEPF